MEGRSRGEHLAQDRRNGRSADAGAPRNRDRPARAHGHGRPGDGVSLREAPARDRRPPPAPAGPVGRGHLLPHAGGLPPVAQARGRGRALRGDRRRFYRERDCRGAADARGGPRRHHARPRSRGRSAGVSRGSVDVPRGLLPAKGRGDADGRGGGRDRPARRQVCPAHDHRWRVDGRRRRRGPRHRAGRRARPAGRATRGERDRGRRVLPPTCSSWATRRSAMSTRVSRLWPTGRSRSGRASCTT